ncbi:peptidase M16 domain protein [Sulfurihydrogenibium sp. YO3AOP1]|uniref:M16 family metallopeptidase n=1 Tax=Sulfurihydrogenibium sp. (strain YO3AOP1) TaxID=436114 RepID=UPI00017235DE|nr:pitrilysin family protein [Sulfurihydrogenibium sp. YO3AOP1]ACD65801.1 peptidase M16 domain protein [Sulfurihydrogenibium sp. YO3AOP1]
MKRLIIIFLLFFALSQLSFGGERVLKVIYPNNLTLIYKQTQGKGIIAGSIFIRGGSFEDGTEKAGLTNLTLKLLLKGSKKYSDYDINKFFEDSGGYISSSSGEDFSNIEFATTVDNFPKAVEILMDILENPLFPEDKFSQEKSNIIAQIKAKKEEGFSIAFDDLRKVIYKDTNYQYSPLGTEESLNKITSEDVRKRWNELLNSNRIVISIVGDASFKEFENQLYNFSKLQKKEYFSFPKIDKVIEDNQCITVHREGQQSTILIAYNAPTLLDKDYIPFRVLNGILGSGFTSRMFQELREKRGLAYATGSYFPARLNIGTVVLYIGTDPKKREDAEKGMREVVKSLKEGIKEEEIKTSKEKILGTFMMDHQTRSKQAYYLGWFETVGLGYQMDKNYPNLIKKVKLRDLTKLTIKYFTKSSCIIVSP